jgi:fumarate reductase subunit C
MPSIRDSFDQPSLLEKLYRANKSDFRKSFEELYPELKGHPVAETWKARLDYWKPNFNWGTKKDRIFLIFLIISAGLFAKIPFWMQWDIDQFYGKNIGFFLFSFTSLLFIYLSPSKKPIIIYSVVTVMGGLYINLAPFESSSVTFQLVVVHLGLVLAGITGVAWLGTNLSNLQQRIEMVKFGANLIIITGLLTLSFGLMTAITFGLYEAIGLDIERVFSTVILPTIGPSIPLISSFILFHNPKIINQISGIIAKLFTPLACLVLLIFIWSYWTGNQDAFENREALLIFNVLLIGVLVLIFFSVINIQDRNNHSTAIMILILNALALVVNMIALSGIVYRLNTYGITPNRMAILGSNILILTTLGFTLISLLKVIAKKKNIVYVGLVMVKFLPIYLEWFAIVAITWPLFFGF